MRPLVNNLGSSLTKNTCSLNISQIPNVFPRSGHSMALFKLKCDFFPDSPDLCCDILTQFLGGIMSDSQRLIKIKQKTSVYLDFMMDLIHDKPKGQCYQCSAGFRSSCLRNQKTTWLKLIPFCPHSLFITEQLSWRSSLDGLSLRLNREISSVISLLAKGSERSVLSSGVVL